MLRLMQRRGEPNPTAILNPPAEAERIEAMHKFRHNCLEQAEKIFALLCPMALEDVCTQ